MLDETNCDAVMIGRGCLGNPWIFKECIDYLENNIKPSQILFIDKINMILKHLNYLLEIKDEKVSLLEMRTHAAWYLKGMPNSGTIKQQIFKTRTKDEFINVINEYKEEECEGKI